MCPSKIIKDKKLDGTSDDTADHMLNNEEQESWECPSSDSGGEDWMMRRVPIKVIGIKGCSQDAE